MSCLTTRRKTDYTTCSTFILICVLYSLFLIRLCVYVSLLTTEAHRTSTYTAIYLFINMYKYISELIIIML